MPLMNTSPASMSRTNLARSAASSVHALAPSPKLVPFARSIASSIDATFHHRSHRTKELLRFAGDPSGISDRTSAGRSTRPVDALSTCMYASAGRYCCINCFSRSSRICAVASGPTSFSGASDRPL
jgi:hypothetical protein